MRNSKKWFSILVLLLALPATACDTKSIAEVKSDPFKYQDKEVRIGGVVTRHFGVLNYGFYEIRDGTGEILVVSDRGVPSKNAAVEVNGNTITAFNLAGVNYGTVFKEQSRKVK